MRRAFRSLWRASTLGSTDYLLGRSSQHFSQYPVFSFSRTMASTSSHGDPEFTNRLALEKSPYLLQHKHNPIEWFPWGEEAFEKARLLDRPIFLSVGYSTCHWCHVMEKESFENKATAKILNDNFVAIKVDREERPDVDKLYMAFIQSISGSGGWPMSVFLTPDLEPFTGGTYFPPQDVYGRPGFPKILNLIANMWRNERNKVVEQGKLVLKAIAQTAESPATSGSLPSLRSIIMTSLQHKISSYDGTHGGFGGAPRFPKVSDLEFLLNCSVWRGEDVTNAEREKSRSMLSKTLHSIAQGGIRDHVHGGFHRYSVDKEWHVPHFEKMLYDEAQLLAIYSDFYQAYGGNAIKDVICTTADYIKDSLTHKEGGFYSAEDADSYPTNDRVQKKEGAAYAWKREDFEEVLDDSLEKLLPGRNKEISLINLLCMYYDIKMGGNVAEESDPHGDLKGLNVLRMQSSHQAFATMFEVSPESLRSFLQEVHKRIKPKRLASVPRPHLDSKIVTAWQGLMISGYSKASAALVEQEYKDAALKAVEFVKKYLVAENGDLLRTVYRNDDDQIVQISHPIAAFSDDYAFMIQGLLDLYEINGDVSLLKWADELQTKMDTKFYDAEKKRGYYISEESMRSGVKVRTIEDQDGAEPCANSVAVNNLIRFADLLDDDKRRDRAHELIMSSSQILQKYSFVLCKMISGYKRMADGSAKIVIVGEKNNELVKQFIKKVNESYIWNKAVVHIDPLNKGAVSYLSSRHALYGEMSQQKEPSVFICDMFACGLPIRSLDELDEKLKKLANISE